MSPTTVSGSLKCTTFDSFPIYLAVDVAGELYELHEVGLVQFSFAFEVLLQEPDVGLG